MTKSTMVDAYAPIGRATEGGLERCLGSSKELPEYALMVGPALDTDAGAVERAARGCHAGGGGPFVVGNEIGPIREST